MTREDQSKSTGMFDEVQDKVKRKNSISGYEDPLSNNVENPLSIGNENASKIEKQFTNKSGNKKTFFTSTHIKMIERDANK